VEGLEQFAERMRSEGFSAEEIERMTVVNPAVALGLE
jgi:predicted metal-dependent phosphotriesterase family hydrolase